MPKVLEFGPYILFFWIGENALNHGYICQKWQETFQGDISFYC